MFRHGQSKCNLFIVISDWDCYKSPYRVESALLTCETEGLCFAMCVTGGGGHCPCTPRLTEVITKDECGEQTRMSRLAYAIMSKELGEAAVGMGPGSAECGHRTHSARGEGLQREGRSRHGSLGKQRWQRVN